MSVIGVLSSIHACGSVSREVHRQSLPWRAVYEARNVRCVLTSDDAIAVCGRRFTRLIPAGALVSCTTGDGKISSKTTAVGDPILCKVQFHRGDFMLPYNSYLGGEFAEYKDPGHFVGKGWMELDFDRLYVGDQVIPISAKVVDVPGYKIDAQGRILGKGHAVRDTVLWMIPVLWPIDLINLPRRGPRPTLKSETALTLRVMDDIQVPVVPEPQRDPYGLYQRGPQSYAPPPAPPTQAPDEGPQQSYAPGQPAPEEQPAQPADGLCTAGGVSRACALCAGVRALLPECHALCWSHNRSADWSVCVRAEAVCRRLWICAAGLCARSTIVRVWIHRARICWRRICGARTDDGGARRNVLQGRKRALAERAQRSTEHCGRSGTVKIAGPLRLF